VRLELLPLAAVSSEAAWLDSLLLWRITRIVKLLPVWRVLKCFVKLRERLFSLTLLHIDIAPDLERIRPVSPLAMAIERSNAQNCLRSCPEVPL
jgi:hypothetical protein